MTVIEVVEVYERDANLTKCVVRSLQDALQLGQGIVKASHGASTLPVNLKVLAIERYSSVFVDELEENFGGLVYLAGELPLDVATGWWLWSE